MRCIGNKMHNFLSEKLVKTNFIKNKIKYY